MYMLYLDKVVHYEPSHQDLRCLQIQLFLSLVVKELILQKRAVEPITLIILCHKVML